MKRTWHNSGIADVVITAPFINPLSLGMEML